MVTVALQPCASNTKGGSQDFFVVVRGVPGGRTLILTNALPLEKAEALKAQVEAALDEYRKPKRSSKQRKPRTAWERLEKPPV